MFLLFISCHAQVADNFYLSRGSQTQVNDCKRADLRAGQQYYMTPDIINRKRAGHSPMGMQVVLAALIAQVLTSQCQEKCFDTPQGCSVCFQQCNSESQASYTLSTCVQSTAPSQGSQNSNQPPAGTVYSSQECGQRCCMSLFGQFEIQDFAQCKEAAEKDYTLMIIIGVLVLIVIVFCCLVAGHAGIRHRCVSCLCEKWITHSPTPQVHPQASMQHLEQIEKSSYVLKVSAPKLQDGICPICLNGGCKVVTGCGHNFHLMCLWEWLRRKADCPLCKSVAARKVWLFCFNCSKEVKKIAPSKLTKLKAMEMRHFICEECMVQPAQ